jgi:K+-transporting ATPase ATPase A chain
VIEGMAVVDESAITRGAVRPDRGPGHEVALDILIAGLTLILLVAAEGTRILGVIHLKDTVKAGMPGTQAAKEAGNMVDLDFAGLAANTPWYNTTLGLAMLIGRFAPIVLALAIAGSLAGARAHARTRATLDTAGPTFAVFLLGVIVIVGGLIYFPMLILGPIGERFTG